MPTPSAAAPPAPDLTPTVEAVLDRHLDGPVGAPVALALSGGGDSLALLQLVAPWAARRGRRLLALTVDHGLHPDSAAWTRFAAAAAARAGADWRGLAWTGPKPATGLPAAAREARHRLLAETARAAGAAVILTGHTADDRLEADRMREADVPGLGRLRAWSPSPAWPEGRGLMLLRPLLGERRGDLRAWLAARGETWLDDPANDDPRHPRVRARRALSPPPAAEVEPPPWPAPEFEALDDGRIRLSRAALSPRLVSAALLCAAGTDRPPRGVQLDRLLDRLAGPAPVDATLAGARLVARGAEVEIGRDAGERFREGLAPLRLPPGETVAWDGRFALTAASPGLEVGPLGGAIGRLGPEERRRLRAIPAWARGALPAVFGPDGGVRLPGREGRSGVAIERLAAPRLLAACDLIARETEIASARNGADAFLTLCSAP